MPRTRECDYCGDDIEPGTGTMFVSADGATTHFCSSKCEKNADLGREARDLEWTEAGHSQGGQAAETEPEPEPEAESEDESEDDDTEAAPDLEAAEADAEADEAESEDEEEEAEEAEA